MLRQLTHEEMGFVSGGDVGTVVIGAPPPPSSFGGIDPQLLAALMGGSYGGYLQTQALVNAAGPVATAPSDGDADGDGVTDGEQPIVVTATPAPTSSLLISDLSPLLQNVLSLRFDCEMSALGQSIATINARTAFDGLNGTNQPEYGNVILANNGQFTVGATQQGESYSDNNPPRTTLSSGSVGEWADVVALVHSHPPSGSSAGDAANIRPSDGDWEAADKITGNFPGFTLNSYADGSVLTLYIVDKDGNVRAFNYMTPAERQASAGEAGNQSNAAGMVTSGGGC